MGVVERGVIEVIVDDESLSVDIMFGVVGGAIEVARKEPEFVSSDEEGGVVDMRDFSAIVWSVHSHTLT